MTRLPVPHRRDERGFTLIELMIVVAIVAILAALAYASYNAQIMKSRRAAATACLMGQVQYMERYYTTRFTYVGASVPATGCVTELKDFYTFSGGPFAAGTYRLTAAPKGAQAADAKCMSLSINEKGVKGRSGTAVDVLDCW
ncbi:prepilin-type N-terminal cleavage/methylation domain-containing protein [Lysobacter sp. K5869]|uniref:type IV pilin protein n=1 Tax=Lysobacter sp. K5869 TaxID=2820808 RepID=UPI001C06457E|nr:type IV pilin protein [Lysobacter sp. K5869]QWP79018.1 prepilin-type N-terminal cleavage/methylation domain-containing protein [Lysobacter sp. K5869]